MSAPEVVVKRVCVCVQMKAKMPTANMSEFKVPRLVQIETKYNSKYKHKIIQIHKSKYSKYFQTSLATTLFNK